MDKPVLIEDLGKLYPNESSKSKHRYGIFKCPFCGNEFKAMVLNVRRGNTTSCGCYWKSIDKNYKHGFSKTRVYKEWADIKQRCYNKNYDRLNDWGGRGITMCDEWKNDFMPFYIWAMANGYSDNLTLNRINNDGNYEPGNCNWTDWPEQNQNKRIPKNNTSGFKGVYWNKNKKKWHACIKWNGVKYSLGYYKDIIKAAQSYNNFVIKNKTFHIPNVIP